MSEILSLDTEVLQMGVIFLLAQVIQSLVIRRGQKGSDNPHGVLTPQQHTWLEQIWEKICKKT
jgi:hypothetical protein